MPRIAENRQSESILGLCERKYTYFRPGESGIRRRYELLRHATHSIEPDGPIGPTTSAKAGHL